MCKLTFLTALLAIRLAASAEPEIKGTATELAQYINGVSKTVVVTGEAEARVPAHRALLSLRVITENRSLQEALRLNLDVRNRLAEFLKKQGISSDRIQASKFSSTPKFGIFSEKAKSYRVENMVRVAVQDEKEFQNAAGTVDMFPEVQFSGVEFEYADKESLKQQAIAKACDNANERAKVYEAKLTLKLVPASFSEGIVAPMNAGAANYGVNTSDSRLTAGVPSYASGGTEPATAESISSFGELVYTARVKVEYSVQSK
jgi:uncharacterized protein YggE